MEPDYYKKQAVICFRKAEQWRFRTYIGSPAERAVMIYDEAWGALNNFLNYKYPNASGTGDQLKSLVREYHQLYSDKLDEESTFREKHLIDEKDIIEFSSGFEERLKKVKHITVDMGDSIIDKRTNPTRPPAALYNIKDFKLLINLVYAIRNAYGKSHANTVIISGSPYTLLQECYFILIEVMRTILRSEGLRTDTIIP